MQMDQSNTSSSVMSDMMPWLHFAGGDNLLFKTWAPKSKGAIAGASIALLFFALFERWVSAMRQTLEARWRQQTLALISRESTNSSELPEKVAFLAQSCRNGRVAAPFIASHDIPRGLLHAFQALLGYVLMLSVMTFQSAYIISIIAGLGLGEMVFGRMGGGQRH